MGIIKKQSIQSSVVIMFGFVIGAFNIIIFAPKVLTAEQIGLTRIITDLGLTMATLCTLGSIPVIYKFYPFYRSYVAPKKNDLPFLTFVVCAIGFLIMCGAGYAVKDIVVRKFSTNSPLFVRYSYLVYTYCFCILSFMWLEPFSWSFGKGVLSNALKETVMRLMFTLLLILLLFKLITLHQFIILFSFIYLVPSIILFIFLAKSHDFKFNITLSSVTKRLKGRMINFGLFVFGSQFLNLLSRTIDTFILSAKSPRGLSDAAVFTIATYLVTIMEVPQRSMNAITIPVLAESWKNKDMKNISNVYKKSVNNLLIIGLFMFALIWLNLHNLALYLGKDFTGIEMVVLFMGIGKLIDMGTGANSQIIGTSSYWKVDFTTNVFYTVLALPLNYVLIGHYGLFGAAISSVISVTCYNLVRYIFLWYKFGLQPYSPKNLLVIALAVGCAAIVYAIPKIDFVVADTIVKCVAFSALFTPLIYFTKISEDINGLIRNAIGKIPFIKGF